MLIRWVGGWRARRRRRRAGMSDWEVAEALRPRSFCVRVGHELHHPELQATARRYLARFAEEDAAALAREWGR